MESVCLRLKMAGLAYKIHTGLGPLENFWALEWFRKEIRAFLELPLKGVCCLRLNAVVLVTHPTLCLAAKLIHLVL